MGGERLRHEILEQLEQISVLVLLPAFFVLSGMRVDLSKVDARALVELITSPTFHRRLEALGGYDLTGRAAPEAPRKASAHQAGAVAN